MLGVQLKLKCTNKYHVLHMCYRQQIKLACVTEILVSHNEMYHTWNERTSNHATCAVSKIYRQELPAVFNILLTRCLRKVISNTYPNMWQIIVYYISKQKAVKPAMCLGSVLN